MDESILKALREETREKTDEIRKILEPHGLHLLPPVDGVRELAAAFGKLKASRDIGGFKVEGLPGKGELWIELDGPSATAQTVITVDQARALATVLIIVAERADESPVVEQDHVPAREGSL